MMLRVLIFAGSRLCVEEFCNCQQLSLTLTARKDAQSQSPTSPTS